MAVPEKWGRWVYASLSNHLHTQATAKSLQLIVDVQRPGSDWESSTAKIQATIVGPYTKETSKGFYRVRAGIVATVLSKRSASDLYAHAEACGNVANILDQCILCKTFGEVSEDELGHLTPRTEATQEIGSEHLRPKVADKQLYSVVAAQYEGFFRG